MEESIIEIWSQETQRKYHWVIYAVSKKRRIKYKWYRVDYAVEYAKYS